MGRKMLINVMHPEEARVAIVQDGRLMELNIEISGKEQTRGNIYKGVVLRVEPGLQAAFVDIGQKKPGFIQMNDLHPSAWQWRDDIAEEDRKRRPRIQEVLHRGQELIVQVEKDARDMKGAALTGYLSLPGRYMVLMPGDTAAGISRKIQDSANRKELKALVADLHLPEGFGYIVRTEALGRTIEDLKKDLEYLLGLYSRIMEQAEQCKAPTEIYRDAGLISRTIRDYFSDDIDEVLVDDQAAWQQAVEFFKEILPGYEKLVKQHREKRPIFSKYQLEEQIDQLYEKQVPLPSGGSLVIEPTEALVSIDVNSGKTSGERGVEDTAYKTNMEAAAEVARQLRLRDLGGLVVIDFIDMRDSRHMKDVEHALQDALKMDKARINVGKISQFGMLEMSRQRIAKNINDAIHLECPHCSGRGRIKSVEAMALSFLRKVHAAAARGQVAELQGGLPLEVAYFLLNRKKRELAQIENDYEIVVTVKGRTSFLSNQLELEVIRREKPSREEAKETKPEQADVQPVAEQSDEKQEAATDSKKKRRRKHKKKETPADAEPQTSIDEVTEIAEVAEQPDAAVEVAPEAGEHADKEQKVEPESMDVTEKPATLELATDTDTAQKQATDMPDISVNAAAIAEDSPDSALQNAETTEPESEAKTLEVTEKKAAPKKKATAARRTTTKTAAKKITQKTEATATDTKAEVVEEKKEAEATGVAIPTEQPESQTKPPSTEKKPAARKTATTKKKATAAATRKTAPAEKAEPKQTTKPEDQQQPETADSVVEAKPKKTAAAKSASKPAASRKTATKTAAKTVKTSESATVDNNSAATEQTVETTETE